MKTFKEFLLMESPISNGKPKWDGKTGLSNSGLSLESALEYDFSGLELRDIAFDCSDKKLTSLEGSPKLVKDFYCGRNQITDLVGSPRIVREEFSVNFSKELTSLKGMPKEVGLTFSCFRCPNLFEVSPLLNSNIEGSIIFDSGKIDAILNKYKNNPKNLIKMLAELKKIDKRFC